MLKLLFGLTGLIAGYGLAHIASEELVNGKKYILLLLKFFFLVLIFCVSYFFYVTGMNWLAVIVLTTGVLSYCLLQHFKMPFYNSFIFLSYFIIVGVYFFLNGSQQVFIASLLFLYGLPVGTLYYDKKRS